MLLGKKNHPYFHVHVYNSLNFHTPSLKLHDFVNYRSAHTFTKNGMLLAINKKVNKHHLTIRHGCEHAHISKRELNLSYIMGVSIPAPSERKPYVPHVMGVGSAMPFKEANCFGCGHTHTVVKL